MNNQGKKWGIKCPNHGCPLILSEKDDPEGGEAPCEISGAMFAYRRSPSLDRKDKDGKIKKGFSVEGED